MRVYTEEIDRGVSAGIAMDIADYMERRGITVEIRETKIDHPSEGYSVFIRESDKERAEKLLKDSGF